MEKTKKKASSWQNRIIAHEDVDPRSLIENPMNYRAHSANQKETMDDALEEVGWITGVIVNKATGRILDGHMRVNLAITRNEKTVPVTWVEMSESDEAKALATFDPLSAMATTDPSKLFELAGEINTDSLYLRQLIKNVGDSPTFDADSDDIEDPDLEKEIPEMERQPFEHYDYIMLVFKSDQDFSRACEVLGIGQVKFPIPSSDKTKIGLGRVVAGERVVAKLCK